MTSSAGLSSHTHCRVWIWCLLTSICLGRWKKLHEQHLPSNDAVRTAEKQRLTSTGAHLYENTMQALAHCWQKCIANGDDYVERVFSTWESALSNSVTELFVTVSMDVNRRHCFQNDLRTKIPQNSHTYTPELKIHAIGHKHIFELL